MGFGVGSDAFVLVAWNAGLGALALTFALFVQVTRMRSRTAAREARRAAFAQTWQPLLAGLASGSAPPGVEDDDAETFLLLWNDLQDAARGEPRPAPALGPLAGPAAVGAMARRLLQGDEPGARVQALRALGHVGFPSDYTAVRAHLDDRRPYLALAAARALACIDPVRAPGDVLERLAPRADWPVSLFVTALAGASPLALADALRALYAPASREQLVRLLPLVTILDARSGDELLGEVLAGTKDFEVLAAALRRIRTPALLEQARRACSHRAWMVRTQAAAAVGRVGGAPDRALLLRLLTDAQWWVRYRAAQALVSGRFGSRAEIAALADALQDRFAREILDHAAAEAGA